MKKTILIILILSSMALINGIKYCGMHDGIYLNVNNKVFKIFQPIETLTCGWVQVDCE